MGSAAVASWTAHLVFWGLVVWGLVSGQLAKGRAAVFVILWFVAPLGLPYVPYGSALFPSLVALFDIVLVFMIFKGDVRLT